MKKILFFLRLLAFIFIISLFLFSCSKSREVLLNVSSPGVSDVRDLSSTGITPNENNDNNTIISSTWTINEMRREMISGQVRLIKKISSLDDLKKSYPGLTEIPGSDHPKFLELQKAQLTFGFLLSGIVDEEYLTLRNEQSDIYQCKEIWTQAMKDMEWEVKKMLPQRMNSNTWMTEEFKKLLEKRNTMMQEFQASSLCNEYKESKKERFTEIDTQLKTYYTPEMLELQNQVDRLNAEVYKSKIR